MTAGKLLAVRPPGVPSVATPLDDESMMHADGEESKRGTCDVMAKGGGDEMRLGSGDILAYGKWEVGKF